MFLMSLLHCTSLSFEFPLLLRRTNHISSDENIEIYTNVISLKNITFFWKYTQVNMPEQRNYCSTYENVLFFCVKFHPFLEEVEKCFRSFHLFKLCSNRSFLTRRCLCFVDFCNDTSVPMKEDRNKEFNVSTCQDNIKN